MIHLWEEFRENYEVLAFLISALKKETHYDHHVAAVDKVYFDYLRFCEKLEDFSTKESKNISNLLSTFVEKLNEAREKICFDDYKSIIQQIQSYFDTKFPTVKEIPTLEIYSDYLNLIFQELSTELVENGGESISEEDFDEKEESTLLTLCHQFRETSIKEKNKCHSLIKFIEINKRKPHHSIKTEKELANFYMTQKNLYRSRKINHDNLTSLFHIF